MGAKRRAAITARKARSRSGGTAGSRAPTARTSSFPGTLLTCRSSLGKNSSLFSREELATIDYWLKHVCEEHTAALISEEAYDYVWEIAKIGETIPMYAVFAARIREPDPEELAWAKQEAESLKRGG